MSKNEHTGDKMQTKPPTDDYRNGHERIWGKKLVVTTKVCSAETCVCVERYKKPQQGCYNLLDKMD